MRRDPLTRLAPKRRSAPSPTRGEGKKTRARHAIALRNNGGKPDMSILESPAASSTATRDPLLQPFRIKSLVLKNRIMSTSHASGLEAGGVPTEAYQLY